MPGFSARCVTRRRDELTGMKKLKSRAVERNVFYELPETWENSSLTDIFKAVVMLLKNQCEQLRSNNKILKFSIAIIFVY